MTGVEDLDIGHVARRRPGSRRPAVDDPVLHRRVLSRRQERQFSAKPNEILALDSGESIH